MSEKLIGSDYCYLLEYILMGPFSSVFITWLNKGYIVVAFFHSVLHQ